MILTMEIYKNAMHVNLVLLLGEDTNKDFVQLYKNC